MAILHDPQDMRTCAGRLSLSLESSRENVHSNIRRMGNLWLASSDGCNPRGRQPCLSTTGTLSWTPGHCKDLGNSFPEEEFRTSVLWVEWLSGP